MGAILTFGILAVAIGAGEFSLSRSLIALVEPSVIGIAAGIAFGYLAALLIAPVGKWSTLASTSKALLL